MLGRSIHSNESFKDSRMSTRFPTLALVSAMTIASLTHAPFTLAEGEAATTQPAEMQPATTQPATTQPAEAKAEWVDHGEGLKSRVVTKADDDATTPKEDDAILVHMSMGLEDGSIIQTTREGEPLTIPLADTTFLDGINIAIRLMRVGERREFLIPPKLAFGANGTQDGVIPPNATLTFDVQLLKILPRLEVTTTAEGTGDAAAPGSFVTVHYTGTLVGGDKDGQKFDSSFDHEGQEPLSLPLGAGFVIPGWERGLVGIKAGEKRTLIVPPHLAYGNRGSGEIIGPDSTLKFEVEGVEVKPGISVTTTKEGEGETAKAGDVVTVHYVGTLSGGEKDGSKFDSSRDRGEPIAFRLGAGRVIRGWDIGLVGMRPGEQRTLIIPSEWGYGPMGAGDDIPPNATLKFEVELMKVE